MTDLRTKLEEMRKLCDAASEGPWTYSRDRCQFITRPNGSRVYVCGSGNEPLLCMSESDAKFSAASRTLVPQLLSALERCLEGLEKYENQQVNRAGAPNYAARDTLADVGRILGGK